MSVEQTREFYDAGYRSMGFSAQRMYPNEELLRFFGSYYFALPPGERRAITVLEVGCGSGANLWMIAREGFTAHGIDLSADALSLCRQMLAHWQTSATLIQGSMTALDYPAASFDVVVDVFSSYCLDEQDFAACLDETARVLKPGGRFFSYTPSKNNDSFKDPGPSTFLDGSTLDGLKRPTSPFYGQSYPFRFTEPEELQALLEARGFDVLRNERIGRTYRNRAEYFEFTSIHAQKRA